VLIKKLFIKSMLNRYFNKKRRTIILCVLALLSIISAKPALAGEDQHFIVGGRVVSSAVQYPFMVSVVLDSNGSNSFNHACGGSLIADRWILTAAHCLYNATFNRPIPSSRVGVRLGESDLARRDGYFTYAKRTIVHPGYDPSSKVNDIALIELTDPYQTTRVILPASKSPVPLLSESGIVLGWGALVDGGVLSSKLREVSLPIVSNAACYPFYPDTFDSRYVFCAGGSGAGGQDACQGDSGGPLLVSRDGSYVVAGLVSYGKGCGLEGLPGVYTRVEAYYDWVTSYTDGTLEYIGQHNADSVDSTQVTRIALNTAISSEVATGQAAVFDVSGAKQVNLTSDVGDADLYIIDSADFLSISAESVQCVSDDPPPLDICVIDNQQSDSFAVVYGYSDSSFTLSSQDVQSIDGAVQLYTADGLPIPQRSGSSSIGVGAVGNVGGLLTLLLLLLFRKVNMSLPRF